MTPQDFLKTNQPWAQSHANAGKVDLNLFVDQTGKPHLLLVGWPFPSNWKVMMTVRTNAKRKAA